MKKLAINLLALLILIMLSSCSTRKLNKQILKSSASEQSETRMQDLRIDKLEAKRKILLTDTANEHYSVIIFPADTFSFSTQHGFEGKAEKIEISGELSRVISRTDSTVLLEEKQRTINEEKQYENKRSEQSNSRELEKKRWQLVNVFMIVLVLFLMGWVLWRGGR